MKKHKMLVFLANPDQDVSTNEEWNFINKKEIRESVELIQIDNTSYSDFNSELLSNKDAAILHFAGHGAEKNLQFEDYKFYDKGLVPQLLSLHNVQLIVLNCCQSKAIGKKLKEGGVPYVIATNTEVSNQRALQFIGNFYAALAQKKTIEVAFDHAKNTINGKYADEDTKRGGLRFDKLPEPDFEWELIKSSNPEAAWMLDAPEKSLRSYHEAIKNKYHEHPLNEKVATLADLYIVPDFQLHEVSFSKKIEVNNKGFSERLRDLHDFIIEFFLKNQLGKTLKPARLLLLLGQPGQGKTSFCLRTMHDCLAIKNGASSDTLPQKHFYFIRLRDIPTRDFINNPLEAVKNYIKIQKTTFYEENTLLILDGLDELSMSAGLTNKAVSELIKDLEKALNNYETLHCILTSRYHYFDAQNFKLYAIAVAALAPLSLEQRQEWLAQYLPFKADLAFTAADLESAEGEFAELLSQPVLLHIVAQSNFKLAEGGNRAKIYEQLFDTLCQHPWNEEGKKRFNADFTPERLREYIGAIAYQIYISEFEYIRRKELEGLEATKIFVTDCLQTKQDLSEALKEVLVSFYFQDKPKNQADDNDEDKSKYALEFMHKSLQEYLTAEYIWQFLSTEFLAEEKKGRKTDYTIKSYDKALATIWEIGAKKGLSEEVVDYLFEIIENDKDTDKKELAERLAHFLEDLLQHQFIYEYKATDDNGSPIDKGLDCFYLYWQVLMKCSIVAYGVDNCPNYVEEAYKTRFVEMLRWAGVGKFLLLLVKQDLHGANLIGADLIVADLRVADLRVANLPGAYLRGAYLRGADLRGANLRVANLRGADLRGAYLSSADLRSADLRGADLRGADLRGAYLSRADLSEANLPNTNLIDANLSSAELNDVNLFDANLRRTIVTNPHWIEDLKKMRYPPHGIKEIEEKYEVVATEGVFRLQERKKNPQTEIDF